MLSKRAIGLAALSLSCVLVANAAGAHAFSIRFQEPPSRAGAIAGQRAILQAGTGAGDGRGGETGARILSSDLFALTVIPPDPPRNKDKAVAGETAAILPVGITSLRKHRVQRSAVGFFDLRPKHGFGPNRYATSTNWSAPVIRTNVFAAVPVPPALPLLAGGILGLALLKRRRSRSA